MSELGKFIVFKAAINLLERRGMHNRITDVYYRCREELKKPVGEMRNPVKAIYEPFTEEELSAEVSRLVTPEDIPWKGEVEVVFQTVAGLKDAHPRQQRGLVLHRRLSHARRLQGREPGLCRIPRQDRGRPYDVPAVRPSAH